MTKHHISATLMDSPADTASKTELENVYVQRLIELAGSADAVAAIKAAHDAVFAICGEYPFDDGKADAIMGRWMQLDNDAFTAALVDCAWVGSSECGWMGSSGGAYMLVTTQAEA